MAGNSWQQPVSGEPSGGTWHKIANPATGWFASKTSGWTADSFTGGLEVDFSTLVPAGTKAVRVMENLDIVDTACYYRKSGDTNISNTPNVGGELTHLFTNIRGCQHIVVWLSSDYKTQFAISNDTGDLYISPPVEYLL